MVEKLKDVYEASLRYFDTFEDIDSHPHAKDLTKLGEVLSEVASAIAKQVNIILCYT